MLTDKQNLPKDGTHFWEHRDFQATQAFVKKLLNHPFPFQAILYCKDLEELISVFNSCFLYVKAAGGVVRQSEKILLIKRLGMIDLPKGHLESNETIEKCAIREVEEECGIQQVTIINPLTHTLHIYLREGNWFLKKTYWYMMNCPINVSLSPQTEEDIEEVFWWPIEKTSEIRANTYPSLWEVFKQLENSF